MAGFPGVIGATDCCQIPISAPHENPDSYINRKGYHSINTQAICDSKRRFLDVFTGSCGSVNDARVIQLSPLREEIMRNMDQYFPEQTHILGDKIYTVEFYLLPPYKNFGQLTDRQKHFNLVHARTRQVIERAFALLLGRFRRLKHLFLQNIEYAALIILACCCLHNICISLNDEFDVEDIDENVNAPCDVNVPEDIPNDAVSGNVQFDPEIKRRIITDALYGTM